MLGALGALCAALACAPRAEPPRLARVGAVNEPVVLVLPAPVERTSLTPAALRLTDADGRALRWEAELDGRELRLLVVLGADELERAAAGWRLELAGFPSRHAVRFAGGGALEAPWRSELRPTPELAPGAAAEPRLLRVDGVPVEHHPEHRVGDKVELLLDGVFDPRALRPEELPVWPVRGELALDAVLPEVSARVVGGRTRLTLGLPAAADSVQLRTRDWRLNDVAGRRLDTGVVIRLRRH